MPTAVLANSSGNTRVRGIPRYHAIASEAAMRMMRIGLGVMWFMICLWSLDICRGVWSLHTHGITFEQQIPPFWCVEDLGPFIQLREFIEIVCWSKARKSNRKSPVDANEVSLSEHLFLGNVPCYTNCLFRKLIERDDRIQRNSLGANDTYRIRQLIARCLCVYLYIYTYLHIHVFVGNIVHIYIYTHTYITLHSIALHYITLRYSTYIFAYEHATR